MKTDPVHLTYEITPEWLNELKRPLKLYGWAPWLLNQTAAAGMGFLFCSVGGLLGLLIANIAGGAGAVEFPAAIAGLFLGWLAMMFLRRRADAGVTRRASEVLKPGETVTYVFEPQGFRVLMDTLDWHSSWRIVSSVRAGKTAGVIQTPMAVFAFPISAVPIPIEDLLDRIAHWRKAEDSAQ